MYPEAKFPTPGFASISVATTGTGRVAAVNDCRQVSWKVTYPSTVPSQGTVVIEHATSNDYAGVWFLLDTVTLADLDAGDGTGFGTFAGEIDFVRARITSDPDQPITVYINGIKS